MGVNENKKTQQEQTSSFNFDLEVRTVKCQFPQKIPKVRFEISTRNAN